MTAPTRTPDPQETPPGATDPSDRPDPSAPDRPPPDPTSMRAVGRDAYGSVDVLWLRDEPRHQPGPGEVLVRVTAAGVDRGALHLMTGTPLVARLALGVRRPKHRVLGREMAGRVEAVGPDVGRFRVGDRVHGTAEGTFAEYACTSEDRLTPTPERLTDVEAAAMPISGITALQGLVEVGRLQEGQHVLVIGASGGVGSFAVQVAKAHGAEVTGVCSAAKADAVRSLGADHVIDHRTTEITDAGIRFDLILDIAGNRSLSHLRKALAPDGTLVITGGEGGGRILGGIDRQARALLLSPFVGPRLTAFVAGEDADRLSTLDALVAAGRLTPLVDRTFPLAEAAAALTHLEEGRACGKVVLTV